MIIDIHAHVYAFPRIHRQGNPPLIFMSAAQQIRRMEEKGIDRAVILPLNCAEAPGERQSIGEVLYICQQYPDRFIPFCDVDPRRADLGTQADFDYMMEQYRDLGCKGLGEFTAHLPFDDPRMMMLCRACAKVGFPITFHTVSSRVRSYGVLDEVGMPRFEQVLREIPDLRFFAHSSSWWSEISGDVTPETKDSYPSGPVTPGGTVPRLLRTYPNLFGDLSAGSGYNALTRDPAFTYEFLDEFQDRLMMGLDHTDIRHDFQHIEWLTAARDEGHISTEILEKILWRNADRLLALGLA